jgi:hypothetical protein
MDLRQIDLLSVTCKSSTIPGLFMTPIANLEIQQFFQRERVSTTGKDFVILPYFLEKEHFKRNLTCQFSRFLVMWSSTMWMNTREWKKACFWNPVSTVGYTCGRETGDSKHEK